MYNLYNLPYELLRKIYEYDNTYILLFENCVNELKYLQKSYPIQLSRVFYYSQHIYVERTIRISQLANYRRFIFDYCNRKKSLRSYKKFLSKKRYM
jgi:hypothetical protein